MLWRALARIFPLPIATGILVWLALSAMVAARRSDLEVIEILFVLAPLVIVPLGLQLIRKAALSSSIPRLDQLSRFAQVFCALSAVVSFLLPTGYCAALFTLPWLSICLLTALSGAVRILRTRFPSLSELCFGVGQLYLLIGGVWFVLSRAGARPLGFYEPIVLLTAVHFHYAGFAAPILAGMIVHFFATATSFPLRGASFWILRGVVAIVLAGPALLAAGFLLDPRVKLVAALALVVGEIGLAAWTMVGLTTVGRRRVSNPAQIFLGLSAISVIGAMVLAALWAIGEYPFQPMLNIPQVAKFHGSMNALGFIFCGLVGWNLAFLLPQSRERGPGWEVQSRLENKAN